MFHFYKLQTAKSLSGFPNIFEIAGERACQLTLYFKLALTPNQLRLFSGWHFSSISQPGRSVIVRRRQSQLYKFSTTDCFFVVGGQRLHTCLCNFRDWLTMKRVSALLKRLSLLVFCTSLTCRFVCFWVLLINCPSSWSWWSICWKECILLMWGYISETWALMKIKLNSKRLTVSPAFSVLIYCSIEAESTHKVSNRSRDLHFYLAGRNN